jgi:hypothetical protein
MMWADTRADPLVLIGQQVCGLIDLGSVMRVQDPSDPTQPLVKLPIDIDAGISTPEKSVAAWGELEVAGNAWDSHDN